MQETIHHEFDERHKSTSLKSMALLPTYASSMFLGPKGILGPVEEFSFAKMVLSNLKAFDFVDFCNLSCPCYNARYV